MVRASLKPSRLLVAGFAAVHLGAAAILIPIDLALELKIAVAAAVTTSLCHSVWRYALLRSSRSIVGVEIVDQENGALCTRDGDWDPAKILGTTYVTPSLTVINARRADERLALNVLLTTDNVKAEDFRRIRVLLRWARPRKLAAEGRGERDASS